MEFKDKLKELRRQKGVSQEELAAAVYKSRSTVAKWETGLRLPDEESLQLLAEYFGVDPSELSAEKDVEAVRVSEDIAVMKKSLSRQKKIIIAVCSVFGAVVLACVVIVIYGLVSMNKPYYGVPAGETYFGIVEYSEDYGGNVVYIPNLGRCVVPSLDEEDHYENSADPSSLKEGDLIRINFRYYKSPVEIQETYPSRFMTGAWSITVMQRNVSLNENSEGYLLTCEYDERFSRFGVGDTVLFVLSEAAKNDSGLPYGAEKLTLFCEAEVVEISDGLITMQLPSVDVNQLVTKLALGFMYGDDSEMTFICIL